MSPRPFPDKCERKWRENSIAYDSAFALYLYGTLSMLTLAEVIRIESRDVTELVLFGAGVVLTLGIVGLFVFLLTRKDKRAASTIEGQPGGGADHDSTHG
jgi:hypothetical protein